jgi:hypothetical protein
LTFVSEPVTPACRKKIMNCSYYYNRARHLLAISAAAFTLVASANAALTELNIKYYGDYSGSITYWNGSAEQTESGVLATAFTATRMGADSLPQGRNDPFTAFSIDIRYALNSPVYWQSGSFPNLGNASGNTPFWQTDGIYRAASLYQAYAGGVVVDQNQNAANHLEGAALQLAIWDVLYGTSGTYEVNDVHDAGFHVIGYSRKVVQRANEMLASGANRVDHNLTETFWDALTDQNGQPLCVDEDLIGAPFVIGVVPEPGTFLGAAAFAGILLWHALRKRLRSSPLQG